MNRRLLIPALLTGLAVCLLRPDFSNAKSQSGGVVDPSTILGFGARPSGMGNAFVAVGSDASAVFWNPSALDRERRKELFGQYSQPFFDNTSYNMLAYKHPLGRFGTVGGGMILEGADDLMRRDEFGTNLGTFDVSKMNLMFSYGRQMTQGLYLGSSLHVVQHQGGGFSGTGMGLDASALYRFTNTHLEYSRAYLTLAREQLRLDADLFFNRGIRAYETGKYAEAFEYFRKSLETDPKHDRAHQMLNKTAEKDRSMASRLQALSVSNGHAAVAEFMKRKPEASLADWFDEGVRLYDAGRLKEAIAFFETVHRRARTNLLTDRLSLGMNVQNLLQPSIKLDRKADKIPTNFKFGAALRPADWLQFALDIDIPAKGRQRLHFGVEWRPASWVALRAGIDQDEPTAGFGFRFQDLKFDYAFEPSDDLDNNFQRIGLSYEFGKSHGDLVSEKIQRGLRMKSEKEHSQAAGEWESALNMQPQNPVARSYLASSKEEYEKQVTGPWEQAARAMESGRMMEAHQTLTAILAYDPNFSQAKNAMAALASEKARHVESAFNRGRLKFLQADFQASEQSMTEALYFRPDLEAAKLYLEAAKKRNAVITRDRMVREWYLSGLTLYRAGDWSRALTQFQTVLSRDPAHPAAGEIAEKILAFRKAQFDAEERNTEAERFFRTALADFINERRDRAELMVSHSLALDPADSDAMNLLGHVLAQKNLELRTLLQQGDNRMAQGFVDQAVERWQKMMEIEPANAESRARIEKHFNAMVEFVETQNRLGSQSAKTGADQESIRIFNRVLTVDPFNSTALQGRDDARSRLSALLRDLQARAEYFYKAGAYDKAIHTLSELMAIDPAARTAQELKAKAEQKADEQAKLARAGELDRQGRDFFEARRFNDAVAAWQKLVTEFGADVSPDIKPITGRARAQIEIAVREAEWAESADLLAEYLRTGDRHFSEGRLVEALEDYARAESLVQDHPDVRKRIHAVKDSLRPQIPQWLAQGRADLAAQKWDEAQTSFRSVLLVDPQNAEASAGMDRLIEERQRAGARFEDMTAAESAIRLANNAYQARDYREALDHLQTALALQPERTEISQLIREIGRYVQMEDVLQEAVRAFQEGDYKNALKKFESVAVLRPDDPAVRDYIAKSRLALRGRERESAGRQTVSAEEYRRSAAEAVRQNRYDLALGRIKKAIDLYQKSIRIDPQNQELRQTLKEAETNEAEWRKIWTGSKSVDYKKFLYSGMSHYTNGRYREAVADWNRVLAADPGHVLAKEYIRRAEKKLDKLEQ